MDKIIKFYENNIWNNPIARPLHKTFGNEHLPSKVYDTSKNVIN